MEGQPGCGYPLPLCVLSQLKGKYHLELKNNEENLSDGLFIAPPADG